MCVVCSAVAQSVKRWLTRASVVTIGIQVGARAVEPPPDPDPHPIDVEIRELVQRVERLRAMGQ